MEQVLEWTGILNGKGIPLQTYQQHDARVWKCLNTFDHPVSDHRSEVKVVSYQRGSNPRRHQLLLYRRPRTGSAHYRPR